MCLTYWKDILLNNVCVCVCVYVYTIYIYTIYIYIYNHHHVQEGLGFIPVP